MPSLTVRSFAEMMHLPMYAQFRILNEQKYPEDEPSAFKIPFYKPSLDLIKYYYRSNNDQEIISDWLQFQAQNLRPESKKINNIRVISSFLDSTNSNRIFSIQNRYGSISAFPKPDVELKLRFDVEAIENTKNIYQFYNFRATPVEDAIAKDTLYLAYWVMEQNHIACRINDLEFIDLTANIKYIVNRQSSRAITNMANNADVVKAVWNSI